MKTIGLLGGMSWESTVSYYRLINQRIGQRLGALHSAELVLYSVDFEPIEQLQHAGAWDEAAERLIRAARSVERAGADLLVICTNTMHKVYEEVAAGVDIPVLHIADATAAAIVAAGLKTVGLLGTRFTMEQAFYRGRLEERHGLERRAEKAARRRRGGEGPRRCRALPHRPGCRPSLRRSGGEGLYGRLGAEDSSTRKPRRAGACHFSPALHAPGGVGALRKSPTIPASPRLARIADSSQRSDRISESLV